MDELVPTIVKCDVEGAEHGLDWTGLPARLHTVALEFHTTCRAWMASTHSISRGLMAQGFGLVFSSVNQFRWETTWRRGAESTADDYFDSGMFEKNEMMKRWRGWSAKACAHEEVFA